MTPTKLLAALSVFCLLPLGCGDTESRCSVADFTDEESCADSGHVWIGDATGAATTCLYYYGPATTDSDFGQACLSDSDCLHSVCMLPDMDGNITNNVFGFCTRGCDCDDSGDAQVSGSDPDISCVYPGGCFVGESQGAWRYVAPKCSDVSECQAIDARYTDCATTDSKTVLDDTCGSLTKVCQAHK